MNEYKIIQQQIIVKQQAEFIVTTTTQNGFGNTEADPHRIGL